MGEKGACGLHCTKINNISVKFGKEQVLKNVNIHVHCGELTVIIGRNGAGKSTLLKAILGEVEHTGNISFVDMKDNIAKRIKIGYVPQTINIEKHMPTTVYDLFASCICHIPVFLKKDKKIYSEIKEKLIGKIIYCRANIEDVYETFVNDIITNELAKETVLKNKEKFLEQINRNKHYNLRTIQFIFLIYYQFLNYN